MGEGEIIERQGNRLALAHEPAESFPGLDGVRVLRGGQCQHLAILGDGRLQLAGFLQQPAACEVGLDVQRREAKSLVYQPPCRLAVTRAGRPAGLFHQVVGRAGHDRPCCHQQRKQN